MWVWSPCLTHVRTVLWMCAWWRRFSIVRLRNITVGMLGDMVPDFVRLSDVYSVAGPRLPITSL